MLLPPPYKFTSPTPLPPHTLPLFTSPPLPPPIKNRKRPRPTSDIDGALAPFGKKKRRLRLLLITSRLSRPFSTPASHCADRGSSRIAVWARQRRLAAHGEPRAALRRAAVLNSARRADPAFAPQPPAPEKEEDEGRPAEVPKRRERLPPSPLGLSNYAALDEDDYAPWYWGDEEEDEQAGGRCEGPGGERVYSDFNFFDPLRQEEDEDEDDDAMEGASGGAVKGTVLDTARRPPSPPDEMEIERERERQKEVSFVRFD
ncbi:hypothetical protein EJ06DRAFT_559484 [Trichodelitschia bisporula]|uniref:Uncharacterized protein n=1 Tax=Trichodelitschia bisporula TaxID=703511 RepID=A0A6G1HLA5_9PEZI|nr:hypothetical protein EJ06DRAFT_559484 [Trichodelitschia bisporula]